MLAHPRLSILECTTLVVALGCAFGVCLPYGTSLDAPLLLIPALALTRVPRVFVACAAISVIGLLSGIFWHPDIVSMAVALSCLFGVVILYLFDAENVMVSPLKRSSRLRDVARGESCDLTDSVENVGSLQTRALPLEIIQRLKSSGQFSQEQLETLRSELSEYRFDSPEESFLSFIEMPQGTLVSSYEIQSTIGKGGSGQVYHAQPVDGGDSVAIKLLRNAQTTERFRREMELVQQLAHPNVVIAYEVGDHQDMPYIAMEKLPGPDLHQYVVQSGPLTWEQSIDVILQAARGLDHAHFRGLIHRDVKPANLIWDHGRVKVADLGLAVVTTDDSEDFHTLHDSVAGTPDFIAPEQARGLGNATEAADIYSLGATWYFLLTGRSRVIGDSLRSKLKCVFAGDNFREMPADLLPESLRHVWEKMTAYEVEDRYQSMTSVVEAIEQIDLVKSIATEENSIEVLVVEDDEDDLCLTVEMVRRANKSVETITANTMKEAVDTCSKFNEIDLVLLDLRLPDSAGVETVERMKEVVPNVPIVVLTGQDDVDLGQACIEAGAEEFACKNDLNAHLMERMIFITLSRFHHRNSPNLAGKASNVF